MSRSHPPVLAGLDSLPDSLTAVEAAAVEASRRRLPLRLVMFGSVTRGRRPSSWRPSFYPLERFARVLLLVARRFLPAATGSRRCTPGSLAVTKKGAPTRSPPGEDGHAPIIGAVLAKNSAAGRKGDYGAADE